MTRYVIKIVVSAVIVASVSELGRRSPTWSAILASLPLTSLLAFVWLYADTRDPRAVATLSIEIFYLVIPSLALFLVLPFLLRREVSFAVALAAAIGVTVASYFAMLRVLPLFRR